MAVLAVVGFHAFPDSVRGGFVGVDVFFVISGYLISSIILTGLDVGRFNFAEFYGRRIRRIFPALILVLMASIACGWVALLTDEFKQFGKHVAAGAGFISNFILWAEAGYFDKAAETKPLLHLWSLGIEEQFYIVWPLTLYLLKKGRLNFLSATLLIASASFLLNIKNVHKDMVEDFYSPATRFWELLAGATLACTILYHQDRIDRINRRMDAVLKRVIYSAPAAKDGHRQILHHVQSWTGFLLILFSIFFLNEKKLFPGWSALLPTTGAYLLIAAGPKAWVNNKILSNKLMVWIGIISFPLYLWHWPLLSFAHILEGGMPTGMLRTTLVFLSIFLAWLTYLCIEHPIRFGQHKSIKVLVLCLLIVVIGFGGFYINAHNGFRKRKVNNINSVATTMALGAGGEFVLPECGIEEKYKSLLKECYKDKREAPRYAVFGDSKGHALYWGLIRESTPNHRWLLMGNTMPGAYLTGTGTKLIRRSMNQSQNSSIIM